MANLFKKKFLRVPSISFFNVFKEIGRNAFVDWVMVLIVSGITAAALIAISLSLYIETKNGTYKSNKKILPLSQRVFDKDQLTSIINLYSAKEEASAQIMKGYRGPTDPSI